MIPRRLAQPVAAGPGMPARLAGVRIGSRALDLVCLTGFGVAALAAYAGTLAPDITWRNGGGDGAELATAAYVWGVAHPPGYPLYLTILRLAQLVPVGEIALRSNALSVVSAVLAGVCVCVVVRSLQPASELSGYVGASFGAAVFAFAPLVWSQAVVTEVYAFEALLLSLFLLLLVRYWQRPSTGRLLLAGIGLGLLVSHHPPFVLAVLPLAWMSSVASGSWRACLAGLVLPLVVALAVLATVALRASFLPWLNWGETTTIGSWLAHVSAASYRSYFLSAAADEDMQRAAYAAASLARQGGWLALALAALGLNWLWQRSRPIAVMCCGMAAFFSVFAVLYNARDSIVYLIPAAMVLALGAGLGAAWLLRSMPAKLAPLLYAALIGSVVWQVRAGWPEVDVAHDRSARDWATQQLQSVPNGAVVHVQADDELFTLWYLQGVEGFRPDVVVVDDRLLGTAWFCRQLARQHPAVHGSCGGPIRIESARTAAAQKGS